MQRPDILVFLSDQHSPQVSSFLGGPARTPALETMCRKGTLFRNAYTACPLCVPSRMSMLLGQLPSRTGIFTNLDSIPDNKATFLHSLVDAGYETVLFGRMHFIGGDQRHGFTRRYVGDTTPVTWTRPEQALRDTRGVYHMCYQEQHCNDIIGGGPSPVQDYDRDVAAATEEYLSRPHKRPQLMVVGTYAPHFPYVAPAELYKLYSRQAQLPPFFNKAPGYFNPLLTERRKETPTSEEKALQAIAAYYGMIEFTDGMVGRIRDRFQAYLSETGRKGVFVYLSDHGDQCGERRLFGKNTFFEPSARIPLIMEGCGIPQGTVVENPVSMLDIGPTLCDIAGTAPPPNQDGRNLVSQLNDANNRTDRTITGELLHPVPQGSSETRRHVLARMARKGDYKLISYHGYEDWDMLFDLGADPEETRNCISERPAIAAALRAEWAELPDAATVEHDQIIRQENIRLIAQAEKPIAVEQTELWIGSSEVSRRQPLIR